MHNEAVARSGALPPAIRTSFVDAFAQAAAGGLQVGAGQSGAQLPAGIPEQIAALAREVFAYSFLDALRPTMSVGVIALVLASAGCLLIVQRTRATRTEPANEHA